MKPAWNISICLAVSLASQAGAGADAPGAANPYASLAVRNVFDLAPMAAAITNDQPAMVPPVKITPNGIISVFGCVQVLFKTAAPVNGREQAYLLAEGQRQDDIEVVHINATSGLITFNNHGTLQDIPLPEGVAAAPPAPAMATRNIPRPGAMGSGYPPYLGDGTGSPGQAPPVPLTKEQQILMIEAQRAYYSSQNDPESQRLARSLPPTAMTPPDAYSPY